MYIYKMENKEGEVIYIGKTYNIEKRLISHKNENKVGDWFNKEVTKVYYSEYKNKYTRDIMEIYYIGKHKPKYNREFIYQDAIGINLKSYEKPFVVYQEQKEVVLLDISKIKIDSRKLNIYEGRLNYIGENKFDLSPNNLYKMDFEKIERIKKATYTYFYNNTKTKSKQNIWTCEFDYINKLKGKGYTRGYKKLIDYDKTEDIKSIAFLNNIFKGKNDNEKDEYALKILLNFIYRYYRDKPINIYIPSKRMRNLLKFWLE